MSHCTGAVLEGSASLGSAAPVRPPVLRLDLVGPGAEPPEHVLGPPQLLLGDHELGAQARDLQIELVEWRRRHVGGPDPLEGSDVRPCDCVSGHGVLLAHMATVRWCREAEQLTRVVHYPSCFDVHPGDHKHHKIADMDEPRSATWIAALPIDPPRGFRDGFASAQERARRTLQAPCRAEDSRLVRWLCDALLRGQFQPPG
jgi:hypothetical protein